MSAESPRGSAIPWRSLGSVAVLALVGIAMYYATPPSEGPPPVPPTPPVEVQSKSEGELTQIFAGMQTGRLDIAQDRVAASNELSRWLKRYPQPADKPLTEDGDLLAELLSPDALDLVQSDQCLPADAAHIRMSFLASEMVTAIEDAHPRPDRQTDADRETELVSLLFEFVWENVAEDGQQKSLTPYEVFFMGRGTVLDRIWCFAELVRQLELDTVIIASKSQNKDVAALVGVITHDHRVLVFDPATGMPLFDPAAEGNSLDPHIPVTLETVRDNPAILKEFEYGPIGQSIPGFKLPLEPEDLKSVQVLIVGNASLWSPRMATVEFRTPVDVKARLYAGLGKNALRGEGSYQRVVAAGEPHGLWKAEDVSVWYVPISHERQHEDLRSRNDENLSRIQQMMQGPMVPSADGTSLEPARNSLEKIRFEQLTGHEATALSQLLPVRNSFQRVPIPLNQLIADIATYRAAECQLALGKAESAEKTLRSYILDENFQHIFAQEAIERVAKIKMQAAFAADREQATQLENPIAILAPAPQNTLRELFTLHRWYRLLMAQGKLPPLESVTPSTQSAEAESKIERPQSPALPEAVAPPGEAGN